MNKSPTTQHTARQRAEVIMKVRCGLMNASQAAKRLGIYRKTYYKWEQQRALSGMLEGLADQPPGRPPQVLDHRKQLLEKRLSEALRDNELLKHKMELKDVLTDLELKPGMDRAKKK